MDIGLLTCGPGESAEVESGNDAMSGSRRKMLACLDHLMDPMSSMRVPLGLHNQALGR